jgi:hypothetical protein
MRIICRPTARIDRRPAACCAAPDWARVWSATRRPHGVTVLGHACRPRGQADRVRRRSVRVRCRWCTVRKRCGRTLGQGGSILRQTIRIFRPGIHCSWAGVYQSAVSHLDTVSTSRTKSGGGHSERWHPPMQSLPSPFHSLPAPFWWLTGARRHSSRVFLKAADLRLHAARPGPTADTRVTDCCPPVSDRCLPQSDRCLLPPGRCTPLAGR